MKFISTKVHGVLDYLVGSLLIAIPWLFGFASYGQETWVLVIAGTSIIIYSFLTQYEAGLMKVLPITAHLIFDFILGTLIIASPWLLEFDAQVYLPHVVTGSLLVLAAIFTRTIPADDRMNEPGLFERGFDSNTSEEPLVASKSRGPWVTH